MPEPPDAKEFDGLLRSGLARLKDAENKLLRALRPLLQKAARRVPRPLPTSHPCHVAGWLSAVSHFSGPISRAPDIPA